MTVVSPLFYGRVQCIHFVGIGGIGMSGIAEVLLGLDLKVHGSDVVENDSIRHLISLGAEITIGHLAENIKQADVVVISSAIGQGNVEVRQAIKRNIPVISRAEMLSELMRLRHGIAVTGAHGKTTTTSLIATLLQRSGFDPTLVIGGKVNHMDSNAKLGKGSFLVAEADESDGSFALLSPSIAVITNIDAEHLDYWQGGIKQLQEEFASFVNSLPFYGLAVLCSDCPYITRILPSLRRRYVTYGLQAPALYTAQEIIPDGMGTIFNVYKENVLLGNVRLHLVGLHNVQNALAAIAVADELSIPFPAIQTALEGFLGVQRRFTLRGEINGITIIDDYGHHPTEIKAVLKAARTVFGNRRIGVLFQPHRYSRTHYLLHEFATVFSDADATFMTDIYGAGEAPIEGIDTQLIVQTCHQAGNLQVYYAGALQSSVEKIAAWSKKADVLIALGAGNVTYGAAQLVELLKQRQEEKC